MNPNLNVRFPRAALTAALVVALGACSSYIKREEYDATLAELRDNDAQLRADVDALESRMAQLERDLQTRFRDYDAAIERLGSRVRVDLSAHFAYDDATLRNEDKPALDDFASVLREHHPDVVVTVEGFTDPAGSAEYNRRLGQRRADAVRDYLVGTGGLADASVRAVSYGEDNNRQVRPGAWGDEGLPNRRVALVVDYAGDAAARGDS